MNQPVHTIGLMGPWEYAWSRSSTDRPKNWGRVRLPTPESKPAANRAENQLLWLRRFFHQPTGLHPGDAVQLLLTAWPAGSRLWLNGAPLGQVIAPVEVREVGHVLVLRNQLLIQLPLANEPWGALQRAGVVLRILPGKSAGES